MYSIKQAMSLALTVCLMLSLTWSTPGRASAQGDTLPGADVFHGEYTPIPLTLWQGEDATNEDDIGEEITAWDLCEALTEVRFHDGDVLYYATFEDQRGDLYYRTIDVSTMQVSQVKFPQVFGQESILSSRSGEGYCHVLTDSAIYTFDAKLALMRRSPWPTALRALMDSWADEQKRVRTEWVWSGWDVNPSGTAIVYKDINTGELVDWDDQDRMEDLFGWEDQDWEEVSGFDVMEESAKKDYGNKFIWVCALEPDAVPQRILPSITVLGNYFTREGYGTPHFVGDDRLFVKGWGWEWTNFWEVWSLDGRRLYNSFILDPDEYYGFFPPCQVKDAHGLFMHNPSSLMYPSSFYFEYETLKLERLPLLSYPPYNGEWVFSAIEGRTCIFAMPTRGSSGQTDRIDFFRCDLDSQTVEPLPLTLYGTVLVNAALAPGGRIVFTHGNDEWKPQYAGVFQCP